MKFGEELLRVSGRCRIRCTVSPFYSIDLNRRPARCCRSRRPRLLEMLWYQCMNHLECVSVSSLHGFVDLASKPYSLAVFTTSDALVAISAVVGLPRSRAVLVHAINRAVRSSSASSVCLTQVTLVTGDIFLFFNCAMYFRILRLAEWHNARGIERIRRAEPRARVCMELRKSAMTCLNSRPIAELAVRSFDSCATSRPLAKLLE